MTASPLTVRDLRRLWKPHKERLNAQLAEHPTVIRFHRACSWLQRAEQIAEPADDWSLLSLWIAFNALYGEWNDKEREPKRDQKCWEDFLTRVVALDRRGDVANTLVDHRKLVMSILDDAYLSRYFWEAPNGKQASQSRKAKFKAQTWYFQKMWLKLLDELVARIYFLRCQLVHGAASHNGKLNRTAVRRCSLMLDHLVRAILLVWIHNGADEDWGTLCYPPLKTPLGAR